MKKKMNVTLRNAFGELKQDTRYAGRVYRRSLAATGLAAVSLALAIGATTGGFAVVNSLLFRSLPIVAPERLYELDNYKVIEFELHRRPAFTRWVEESAWWQNVTAYRSPPVTLSAPGGRAFWVNATETTAAFFPILGCRLTLGRLFAADEDVPGHDAIAVISYGVWENLFGGDPNVLGATVRLNGAVFTVVGVAAQDFDFPNKTSVWTPTYFDSDRVPKSDGFIGNAIGRLRTDLTVEQATAMARVQFNNTFPREMADPQYRLRLISLRDRLIGPVRHAALTLFAMLAFVLLIACINIAQLVFSQLTERRKELAVRSALGATRFRLIRQLSTEAALLTMTSGLSGLIIARWASRIASAAQPAPASALDYTVFDWRVLGFVAGTGIVIGIFFGVVPVLVVGWARVMTDPSCYEGRPRSGLNHTRAALVSLQTALTVSLVAGSFAMGRSFLRIVDTDLGFRTNNAVTLTVSLLGSGYDVDRRALQYYARVLQRLQGLPGVEWAGAADNFPLIRGSVPVEKFKLRYSQTTEAVPVSISPGYFRAIGATLVSGREFSEVDKAGSNRVAIVDEEFVHRSNSSYNLVSKSITLSSDPGHPLTIVGVVRSIRFSAASTMAQLFVPMSQQPPTFATLVARVHGEPGRYLRLSRDAVQSVDSHVSVYDVKTLDQRLMDLLAKPHFYTIAIQYFGGFALLLAALNAYGIASYSVAKRTREIGIRIAVGASPLSLRTMLLWECTLPVALGMLGGIGIALCLSKFLTYLIAGAEPIGVQSCLLAILLLAVATGTGVWIAGSQVVGMDANDTLSGN